ncbi:BCCT family transporter [Oceanimonas sp. MB9]|uniref:BCCT family transporter n=1 Tax=Oceanimonas sp. MB9 TaxID=2588453 RepID=UPI0013F669D5|nr:Glycine betaine/proline betaine transporter BetS [Oceanimonas sp. MB9]
MVGKDGILKGMSPAATISSMVIVTLFVLGGALYPDAAAGLFSAVSSGILTHFKWYYIAIVALMLVFCVVLAFSRFGQLRLGSDDARPEYGLFSWFAMLFSAGMGIGLVFWSIAEPIYHFQANPFIAEGLTPEAAEVAMRITFFHWGLHPWAIYVVVGLALAYFSYRRGLPLTIRSALYPLIGKRIYGWMGHTVDVLAVFGTVFGVATSLGLGVAQINTGLNHLFGVEVSTGNQLLLILVISLVATASVLSGIGRGVKWLSEINIWLTVAILVFLLAYGPTSYLLQSYVQGIGDYLAHVVPLSTWTDASKNSGWQSGWTVFYWGWWMSWSPFVGMFIARISRGRTIREFICGVLLVPTLLGMLWLTLFGGTALFLELTHTVTNAAGEAVSAIGQAGIVTAVGESVTSALYVTLSQLDGGTMGYLASLLATVLVALYFITSADSGTLVVTTILSLGEEHPPRSQRVIWGLSVAAVAAILMLAGGLTALQTAAIIAAFPFSMVIMVMMWGLFKGLHEELPAPLPVATRVPPAP